MTGPSVAAQWAVEGLVASLVAGLVACTHSAPGDVSLADRVLAKKALRMQVIEHDAADPEFVHEILHQVGQGPDGDRRLAQLLAEHLHHHPATAQAVFHELARHRGFQDWVVERLRGRKDVP